MASKRRLRRKECEGKVRYPSHEVATAVRYKRPIADQLHVYKCPHCCRWHLAKIMRRQTL